MRHKWRKAKPKPEKKISANERIRVSEVFLIGEDGEALGVMSTEKAISLAEESDMDLILVNPKVNPPVARLGDLGQIKYEQDKKAHKQKVQQKKIDTKAIRLSVRISSHDFDFRQKQAIKFLEKGNKLRLEINLRGRERQHPEKAKEVITSFVELVKNNGKIEVIEEQGLTKQGGRFTILLANKN